MAERDYEIEMRLQGIPAIVRVTGYIPGDPGRWGATMPDSVPPTPPEVDYEILDRHGYRAPWLEEKLTPEDHERITDRVVDREEDV